ncbi:MAG: hypothetical protein KC800_25750, partial [Candidatus Eremiobacteraeota bacterium]|nr:hypothetical protein [Candidatus Eremiobacteraeota bacterium]
MRITTHEQRCWEISEWCRLGWVKPFIETKARVARTKPCRECGRSFESVLNNRYCSSECRQTST